MVSSLPFPYLTAVPGGVSRWLWALGILLTALSGIVVTCAPVSTIADMFRMCLGFLCLRWNLDVFVVEVRTMLAFDVTPVVGLLGVRSDRWKKISSSSVVVLLPLGILLWSVGFELVASVSCWLSDSAVRMR